MSEFLAIARERVFSPGKVDADRAILEAVAEVLRQRGHHVRVTDAEDELPALPRQGLVFTMSQGAPALATLRAWEQAGVRIVNTVDSILNCHRHRMLACFQRAGVAAPETILLDGQTPESWPAWLDGDGGWIKRGDVHATQADDVVHVRGSGAAIEVLRRFRARGITLAVLQRHANGQVIKFYGVRQRFFASFPSASACGSILEAALRRMADTAAAALGLDVYGGDCVASVNGGLQLIDLNDWPSYAPCRAEGAAAIAAHLEALSDTGDR